MEGSNSIVVKVKHGDVLRRFNAHIVDKRLDLNMADFRKKICSLFNFAPDADLTLTYIDEDSDVVTLVNDDDLHDVVQQSLNPWRVTVKLNSDVNGRNCNGSSPVSTEDLTNFVTEILDKAPETLRGFLSQIPNGLDGSSPVSTQDLKNFVSEVLERSPEPLRGLLSEVPNGLGSLKSGTVPDIVDFLSKIGLQFLDQHLGNQSRERPTGAAAGRSTSTQFSNFCADGVAKTTDSEVVAEVPSKDKVKFQDVTGGNMASSSGTCVDAQNANVAQTKPDNVGEAGESIKPSNGSSSSGNPYHAYLPPFPGLFAGVAGRSGPPSECPFSGTSLSNGAFSPPVRAWEKRFGPVNSRVIHRGIRCDGCGVYPISGPRYKSNVKYDFDLCSSCFGKEGSDADYTRMDHPVHYPHQHARALSQRFHRGCKAKQGAPKLDSRFIQDVNIFDGTVMSPLTPFTKIWRMRNNGSVAWPPTTQLIPSVGLAVDQELDVAVDFISPELPGRYVSYWKLASPSGQKFGQRVWVLIQVDASVTETPTGSVRDLNLNLPPMVPSGTPEIGDIGLEPAAVDTHSESDNSKKKVEVEQPVADSPPKVDLESKFPINDSLLVGGDEAVYPTIDLRDVASSSFVDAPPASAPEKPDAEIPVDNVVLEDKLLKELDDMGFEHIDLNKEILRMKEYDMEQTVDELCGVSSEWDPLLEELQEMGFYDKELNKKMLEKNNGSIQRAVLDLLLERRELDVRSSHRPVCYLCVLCK